MKQIFNVDVFFARSIKVFRFRNFNTSLENLIFLSIRTFSKQNVPVPRSQRYLLPYPFCFLIFFYHDPKLNVPLLLHFFPPRSALNKFKRYPVYIRTWLLKETYPSWTRIAEATATTREHAGESNFIVTRYQFTAELDETRRDFPSKLIRYATKTIERETSSRRRAVVGVDVGENLEYFARGSLKFDVARLKPRHGCFRRKEDIFHGDSSGEKQGVAVNLVGRGCCKYADVRTVVE